MSPDNIRDVGLGIDFLGAIFLFLEGMRVVARTPKYGIYLEDQGIYRKWIFRRSAIIGFILLALGFLIQLLDNVIFNSLNLILVWTQ